MVLLDADRFLNELTKLYESTREAGTVWVTLKRSRWGRPANHYEFRIMTVSCCRKCHLQCGEEIVIDEADFPNPEFVVNSDLQPPSKRKTDDNSNSASDASEFRCLVRATDGKKKISTSLSAKEHHRFQMAYATVLKAHMDTLKRREKKDKKEKKVATGKAKPTGA